MDTRSRPNLASLTLAPGQHAERDPSAICLLEAAAWFAGEEHSDHPRCVCPVLAAVGRSVNDHLPPSHLDGLVWLVPRMVGTAGDGRTGWRTFLAADWLVRTWLPPWLAHAAHAGPRLTEARDAVTALPPLREVTDVLRAHQVVAEAADAVQALPIDEHAVATTYGRKVGREAMHRSCWHVGFDGMTYGLLGGTENELADAAWRAALLAAEHGAATSAAERLGTESTAVARQAARSAARARINPTMLGSQGAALALLVAMAGDDEPGEEL